MQIYQKSLIVLKIYFMQRWDVGTINLSYNIGWCNFLLSFYINHGLENILSKPSRENVIFTY
jgi:hypothetical protein